MEALKQYLKKKEKAHFRALEQKNFSSIPNENCLVALGGGSIENDIIFEKIINSSNAFYLMDNIENLWERIKDTDRPLVKKGKEEVIKLFNKRVSLYEKVLNKIDMSKTTINEASEIVIESTWLKDARI